MKTVGDGAFRREDLNSRSNDMTYSGALSFLRRKYSRDLTGVDVVVTGIPVSYTHLTLPTNREVDCFKIVSACFSTFSTTFCGYP